MADRATAPDFARIGVLLSSPVDSDRVFTSDLVACIHCGFIWQWVPGSGRRRGFCSRCHGFCCGRACCEALGCRHWMHDIENLEAGRPMGTRPLIVDVPLSKPDFAKAG